MSPRERAVPACRRSCSSRRRRGGRARALVRAALVPEVAGRRAGSSPRATSRALGAFTFVEAAILLVAVAVRASSSGRARSRRASTCRAATAWRSCSPAAGPMLLLVCRLFDKPDIQGAGATMGIQWGIFGAMLAAGALIAAGARVQRDARARAAEPRRRRRRLGRAAAPRARAHAGPPPARRDRRHRVAARPPGVGGRDRATRRPRASDDAPTTRLPGPVGGAHAPRTPPGAAERLWEDEPPR